MGLKSEATAHIDALVDWLLPKNRRLRVLSLLLIGAGLGCAALITPFTGAGVLAAGVEYLAFPLIRSEIEAVRTMLETAPCGPESMAYHTAIVAWNTRIAREHESQQHWYSDPWSPDVPDWVPIVGGYNWMDVPLLELPTC
jgi:hypothetical protein